MAVHGLDENEFEAWTDPSTEILWLRDLLPQTIDQIRVLTFGYAAYASSFYGSGSSDRIQQHAHTLVADVQADRALEGCSERPLIFVCHGLGGILVKKALSYSASRTSKNVEHLHSIFTSTYAILFFGTPHHGLKIWTRATVSNQVHMSHASRPDDSQMLSAVKKDSETLEAITDQFAPLMKQFHVFFFWEELESDFGDRIGYVVDENSAAPIMDNTERAGIHANHAQMVRFSHTRSSSYRTVAEALVRYCRDAPSIIARRWQQATEALTRARSNEAQELAGVAFNAHNNDRPFEIGRKIPERPHNKFFFIPQVVSSIFTGREGTARSVIDSLLSPIPSVSSQQRRFVIHGIGGSGKTQFCSKFAQDNRDR